jgi:hypothetical protein
MLMMRFVTIRIVLLTLCAGLFAYQGEAKAQSVGVPSAKKTRTDAVNLNLKASVSTAAVQGTSDTLGVGSASGSKRMSSAALAIANFDKDKLGFRLYEDCGPDKGKCSGDGHCCLIGGSGWCCAKDQKCGEEIGDCK